jgi:hypothetical protein
MIFKIKKLFHRRDAKRAEVLYLFSFRLSPAKAQRDVNKGERKERAALRAKQIRFKLLHMKN